MMTSARSQVVTSLGLCAALLLALGCGGKASEADRDTREESDDGASFEDDGETSHAAEAGSDAAGGGSAADDSEDGDSADGDSEGGDSEDGDSEDGDSEGGASEDGASEDGDATDDDGDATDEDATGDAASSSSATEPASTQLGSLTIAQLPGRSPSPLTAYFAELEGVDGVSASFEYHFALGVGYLDEFTIDLENALVVPCWVGALDEGPNGEFEVESVVVEGSSATIEGSGLDHFALSLHDTGVTTATVEGVFHPADPDSCEFAFAQEIDDGLRFSLTLDVEVHRPAGVTFEAEPLTDFYNPRQPCTHVLSGAPLFPSGFGNVITLVDEAGVEFSASNADSWRPITVTVVGTEDTEFALLDEERGLASLYARGPDQVLKIESEWGPAGEIALVTPESIDDLHVFYALHGYSRAELWLESGEALDGFWDDTEGLWLSASPRMWSGGHEICSVPPLDTFLFSSASPEVCDATEPRCTSCDADLAAAASLLGSGRCELRLGGPRFNGGQGLEHAWHVDFEQQPVE